MKQISKKKSSAYGLAIECYLTADRRNRPQAFIKLIDAVEEMAGKLMHSLGLKAVEEENQVLQAQDHLIKGMSLADCKSCR